jgi:N-acyl-D-aspartate/D-glutamate deacylase
MMGASYTTRFLGDCLRGRKLVPLERAVQMLTDDPARLFGLKDRGRIATGYHADVVVLDPDEVGAENATLVHDLPGGTARLMSEAKGVVRVYVNGVEIVVDNKPTGELPGSVLRSGVDTYTVATS